jgi:hypothetical protein
MLAANGLIVVLDGDVVAVELEDDEVPDFNGVRTCELSSAVVEVHLADAVELHLHGPKDGQVIRDPRYEQVGLLPIDHRRKRPGEAQPLS